MQGCDLRLQVESGSGDERRDVDQHIGAPGEYPEKLGNTGMNTEKSLVYTAVGRYPYGYLAAAEMLDERKKDDGKDSDF